jgi:transcription antitermination factor NusG
MSAQYDEALWYAVLTRSRQEKTAAAMLESQSITHFLPLLKEDRRWSDRNKTISVPLFPGYVFVQIVRSSTVQLRVLKVPGIIDFVSNREGPLAIPEGDIKSVRALVSNGVGCSPHPFLRVGERVRVVRGVLAGIEGNLSRRGAQSKLVISVEMLQRSVSVNVDESDVEAVYCLSTRQPRALPT